MGTSQQKSLFYDYDGFVEKFKRKKTTDDCITPPEIYKVVRDWACKQFDINPENIVRPFYPDGDYQAYDYPADCCVLDNPPFSILSQILDFYCNNSIRFFLFAPTLTNLSAGNHFLDLTHILAGAPIIYDNGAKVSTSFITNCDSDTVAMSAPDLYQKIKETTAGIEKTTTKQLPKYEYPENVITAARIGYFSAHEVLFSVRRKDCCQISGLDSQKPFGKAIFGKGLLLSSHAAAEHAAAEHAAAEHAAAKRWELSDREFKIIQMLDEGETGDDAR